MNKIISLAVCLVAANLLADTQVYRIELDTETDIPSIVGQDGVKRQVCIVEPEQYALLTGRLSRVWASLNSTHEGRVKIHGKVANTIVDTNTLTKTTEYSDGYKFVESFEVRTAPVIRKFAGVKTESQTKKMTDEKPKGMSDKRWAMRQAYIRLLQKKAKEISVIHDATTGKDYANESK